MEEGWGSAPKQHRHIKGSLQLSVLAAVETSGVLVG